MTEGVSFERLRLNHYVIKSEQEFRLKVARGAADTGLPEHANGQPLQRGAAGPDGAPVQRHRGSDIQMYLGELKEALARHEPAGRGQ